MPRKRALKSEVADGIREVGLGAYRTPGIEIEENMTAGTAVYGTVRTVVWEDGGRKPSVYQIQYSLPTFG